MRLVRPTWSPLPSPSKSKFTPSSDLAVSNGTSADESVPGRGGRGGERVERTLVEVGHREDDTFARGVGPGDEVGEGLALEAVPARTALVERAVGVHVDGEVGQGGQAGDAEGGRLGQRPVRREGEVLPGGQRRLVDQGGGRGRRRGGGRCERDGRGGAELLEGGVAAVVGQPGVGVVRRSPPWRTWARVWPPLRVGGGTADPPIPRTKPPQSMRRRKRPTAAGANLRTRADALAAPLPTPDGFPLLTRWASFSASTIPWRTPVTGETSRSRSPNPKPDCVWPRGALCPPLVWRQGPVRPPRSPSPPSTPG